MSKENNKMQVDIDTLKKQNVNDLLSIKELYRKLKEVEEKISQFKYIDNTLVKKIKKEYVNLKKIILDENVQVKLTNDIDTINSQMDTINSQMDTIISEDSILITNEDKEIYINDTYVIDEIEVYGSTNPVTLKAIAPHIEFKNNNKYFCLGFDNEIKLHGFLKNKNTIYNNYVKENIVERIIDGMEGNWRVAQNNIEDDFVVFRGGMKGIKPNGENFYSTLPYSNNRGVLYSGDHSYDCVSIYIAKNELDNIDIVSFRKWLNEKKIKAVFELSTPQKKYNSLNFNEILKGSYEVSSNCNFKIILKKKCYNLIQNNNIVNTINVCCPPLYTNIKPFINDGITCNYESFLSLAEFLKGKKDLKILFPKGEYRIDKYIQNGNGITNIYYEDLTNIIFSGYSAKITVKGDYVINSKDDKSVCPFYLIKSNNLTIEGFEIDGENYKMSTQLTGSQIERFSHLLNCCYYNENLTIKDVIFEHSGCDGFAIGGIAPNTSPYYDPVVRTTNFVKNTTIERVISRNNGRMGLTIGVVQGLKVYDSIFESNGNSKNENYPGISPKAGIDIEPNEIAGDKEEFKCLIKGIEFHNCKFRNNINQQFTCQFVEETESLKFYDCLFENGVGQSSTTNLIGSFETVYNNCKFKNVSVPMYGGAKKTHIEHTTHNNSQFYFDELSNIYLMGDPRQTPLPTNENKSLNFNNCKFTLRNNDLVDKNIFKIFNDGVYPITFNTCSFDFGNPNNKIHMFRGVKLVNCDFQSEVGTKINSLNIDETTYINKCTSNGLKVNYNEHETQNNILSTINGYENIVKLDDNIIKVSSLPNPIKFFRGKIVIVCVDGKDDIIYRCLGKSDGSFEWVTI